MENDTAAGHETTDVHPSGVWLAGLGLIVCTVLIMLIVSWFFNFLRPTSEQPGEVESSVAASVAKFPGPRLQVSPQIDLQTLRAKEDAELQSYGWTDKKAGTVRIPIERAMDLLIQRGVPVRGEPGAPQPGLTLLQIQQERAKTFQPNPPK
ncbi:MAG TPA: hypothetical protein VHY22_01355 [Chthoniobacteraceae bacterium]|jgi:hypothetical protein|nr:hypothetical protein [Chthoniobacteraceae bacterium]